MVLEKLKVKGTLSDRAYISLKQSILSLRLKPGENLLEDRLSEMLGISRTPIRQALNKLAHDGLVNFIPGKGTYVTDLTPKNFLEIYPIRDALETLSIEIACQKHTKEDILKLKALLDEQIYITNKDILDDKHFLEIDRQIHTGIAMASKNDVLVKYLMEISDSYKRYLYFTKFEKRAQNVIDEHAMVIDAIEKRDSVKAVKLMGLHLDGVKESIYDALMKAN